MGKKDKNIEIAVAEINDDDLKAAIAFYENSPDGQYDTRVVVPILKQELQYRTSMAALR